MPTIDHTVLDLYEHLSAQNKLLVRLVGEYDSDEVVANHVGAPVGAIRRTMARVASQLGLPPAAAPYVTRQQLAEVARRYQLCQKEPTEEAVPEKQEQRFEASVAARKPAPSVENLVLKIPRLKQKWKDTVEELNKFRGWGSGAKLAASLGISVNGLHVRLGKICEFMGISHLAADERKELLRQAWQQHVRLSQAGEHPAMLPRRALQPVPQPPAELSAPVPSAEAPQQQLAEEPAPTLPGLAQVWGQGVTLLLPEDVTTVDVVSGVFNGTSPSKEVEAAIGQRKQSRLRPFALALYPSQSDPAVTLGHLVMVKR